MAAVELWNEPDSMGHRRAWGNTAVPVDGATVAGIRKATQGRTETWTAAELSRLR